MMPLREDNPDATRSVVTVTLLIAITLVFVRQYSPGQPGGQARIVLIALFAVQFLSNSLTADGGAGVAFRAYLGGCVAGMALAALLKQPGVRLSNPLLY
ncbi:MAG: hypothetical protein WDZ60_03630 [Wenzhouxiangellaceae bacterium]